MFKLIIASVLLACALAAPRVRQVPMLDGRIVGGRPANIEEFPYQISLLFFGSHICGGSLIADRWVVTAAHCTDDSTASMLSVRLGSSIRNSGGEVVTIQTIHQHPNYDWASADFDISVLFLSSAVSFTDAISTIPLPAFGQAIIPGSNAVISGWGRLIEGGSLPSQLQVVEVPVISQEECRAAYGASSITDRMMCAGIPEGGRDACHGDSGGPLVVDGQLIGIVSWGEGCARPAFPGVYSSVPALRDYITTVSGI